MYINTHLRGALMKLKNKFFIAGISAFMLAGLLVPNMSKGNKSEGTLGPDNAEYEEPLVMDYNNPTEIMNLKMAAAYPTKVTLHYHNDSGGNDARAFYIWFNGINGEQYAPDHVSDDGKDMDFTIDFTTAEFKDAYKRKLYLIIKSSVEDNWDGKSDDTYLDYSQFTVENDGSMSIWIIPGEASTLEAYDTEADTKMDKVLTATFKADWRTIVVRTTILPTAIKVYALTGNYYKRMGTEEASTMSKEEYLIRTFAPEQFTSIRDVTFNGLKVKEFKIQLNEVAKVNCQYSVSGNFSTKPDKWLSRNADAGSLYETERFEKYYQYSGNDLGVTYGANATTFKVWAPTACRVRVNLYDIGSADEFPEGGGSETVRAYNMSYRPGGVWEITLTGKDLNGKYYKYDVVNSLGRNEAVDPYAHACGINGERGMILDFSKTNPTGWENVGQQLGAVNPNDLVIYESHIRDLTMDETWTGNSQRGTYKAYIESGTTYQGVKTGFDHIEEMGFNAIQFTPVFDYDNVEDKDEIHYNWGYNPLNYNCIEGGYSTNPYDGAVRVKEFKEMIMALANNANHTRSIMDVVYNHVQSAPASNFNKIMPKYYFRLTKNGYYYNGSGCGNEVKTEAPMMSKFVVDSLCWWAKEYKIKGFRFDLMGLIDWKTLDKARAELYKIDPSIYLYGEGWTGDGSDSGHVNVDYYGTWGTNTWTVYNKLPAEANKCHLGGFNDRGRNSLKGGNTLGNADYSGFVAGNAGGNSWAIADLLAGYQDSGNASEGSVAYADPYKCVNYASCHDNYALFDQLTYTAAGDGKNNYPTNAIKALTSAEATIMLSNGVAFFQGGEELFRSKEIRTAEDNELAIPSKYEYINGKKISHDSYNLSDDVNSFKWDRKISVDGVSTSSYVEAMKAAIKAHKDTAKYTKEDLQDHNPFTSTSGFRIEGRGDGSTSVTLRNNGYLFWVNNEGNHGLTVPSRNDRQIEAYSWNGMITSTVLGYVINDK